MEVRKNILYWFTEGQTHFGTPKGAKMSFGPLWSEKGCSSFKFKHYV